MNNIHPASFGPVTFNSNSNLKLSGNENSGVMINNSNLNLSSFKSILGLLNNSNSKLEISESQVKLNSCSNVNIQGKNNNLDFKDSNNLKFHGDNYDCEMKGISNAKIEGNQGKVQFIESSNVKVSGNKNQIYSNQNSNFKVSGDNNKLGVEGTVNHHFQRIPDNEASKKSNLVQLIPNVGGSGVTLFTSSRFGFASSSINSSRSLISNGGSSRLGFNAFSYFLEYFGEAKVCKDMYEVGQFKFRMVEQSIDQAEITFDDSGLDIGSFVARKAGVDKYLVEGKKGGIPQSLEIVGPHITQIDPKVFQVNKINPSFI